MKLLTITNLYPGEDLPRHGVFVEERLRHLVDCDSLSAEVIALRPGSRRDAWTAIRHGIKVHYVRVPTLPVVTNWIDPLLWRRAVQPVVEKIVAGAEDDVLLDAHFLYPDGVAVALIGNRLKIPTVLTARGSDVNVKCRNAVMRSWVRWAARSSAAVITVSKALRETLVGHGFDAGKIFVLRNGVDLDLFSPPASVAANGRKAGGRSFLSVGHLLEEKGHHLAIGALADIAGAVLTIVGEGPYEGALKHQASTLGVDDRVRFLGHVPHEAMAAHYAAADATVLASVREGMPNVILESLACGTRVVATDVGGIAEVVKSPEAGFLMAERSSPALTAALTRLETHPCGRDATRQFAVDNLGWPPVIDRQRKLYESVLRH